jgi:hypothetical protein
MQSIMRTPALPLRLHLLQVPVERGLDEHNAVHELLHDSVAVARVCGGDLLELLGGVAVDGGLRRLGVADVLCAARVTMQMIR